MKNEWNDLSKEVDEQNIKQMIYDDVLLNFAKNDIANKKILDYGCGTGEIALRLAKLGGNVDAWDESEKMRKSASVKLGKEKVFNKFEEIPKKSYDTIFCNLVLCIVDEKEDKKIMERLRKYLTDNGVVYIGFCNPLDYNIKETRLQYRKTTGANYGEHHVYKKTIKDGGWKITERHKPIEFYEKLFVDNGFVVEDKIFSTPEIINGEKRSDFVVYKLEVKD
jgi:2-polyprenyl-3-methyl-5-hydroxy-6-metoxy-1,4-benzoquinol methylase